MMRRSMLATTMAPSTGAAPPDGDLIRKRNPYGSAGPPEEQERHRDRKTAD